MPRDTPRVRRRDRIPVIKDIVRLARATKQVFKGDRHIAHDANQFATAAYGELFTNPQTRTPGPAAAGAQSQEINPASFDTDLAPGDHVAQPITRIADLSKAVQKSPEKPQAINGIEFTDIFQSNQYDLVNALEEFIQQLRQTTGEQLNELLGESLEPGDLDELNLELLEEIKSMVLPEYRDDDFNQFIDNAEKYLSLKESSDYLSEANNYFQLKMATDASNEIISTINNPDAKELWQYYYKSFNTDISKLQPTDYSRQIETINLGGPNRDRLEISV